MRRPLRRRFPPPPPPLMGRRGPVARAVHQRMLRANQLLETGQYGEAARLFAELAELPEAAGFPGRAARLTARAGHAWLLAGDVIQATTRIECAVLMHARAGNIHAASQIAHRAISEFETRGCASEATALRAAIDARLREPGLALADVPAGATRSPARTLPAKCPSCGGPVRPDEAEWLDEVSAACAYCGSVLKAE